MWYLTQNVSRHSPTDEVEVVAASVVVVDDGTVVVAAVVVVVDSACPVQAVRMKATTRGSDRRRAVFGP
jgi:hypothetical protein